jgi:hypothetical protein
MEQRTDHIKKLRSASIKRASGLSQELRAERTAEFVQDPKARTLLRNLRELQQCGAPHEAIKEADGKQIGWTPDTKVLSSPVERYRRTGRQPAAGPTRYFASCRSKLVSLT